MKVSAFGAAHEIPLIVDREASMMDHIIFIRRASGWNSWMQAIRPFAMVPALTAMPLRSPRNVHRFTSHLSTSKLYLHSSKPALQHSILRPARNKCLIILESHLCLVTRWEYLEGSCVFVSAACSDRPCQLHQVSQHHSELAAIGPHRWSLV